MSVSSVWRVSAVVASLTLVACAHGEVEPLLPSTTQPLDSTPSTTSTPETQAPTDVSGQPDPEFDDSPPARLTGDLPAAELATMLTTAERELDGVTQQLVYRYLAGRPELDEQVLAVLADDVRRRAERLIGARRFGQQRAAENPRPPEPTIPAWTIVEPLPVDELRSYYDEAAALTGIDWFWLAAINLQETRFGRIVGVSSAGAVGPMQFLPSTWAGCCTGDPLVARDAIIGAATYLVQRGGPDDMLSALYGYNPNPSYVAIVTAYAENLRDHPEQLTAYHQWQVFVGTTAGTIRLPVGFSATTPVDGAAYLADHPEDLATVTP